MKNLSDLHDRKVSPFSYIGLDPLEQKKPKLVMLMIIIQWEENIHEYFINYAGFYHSC